MAETVVKVDLAKYKFVDLPAEDAIRLLEAITEKLGRESNDIRETIRYIRNFEEFYEYMQKKFKDYIAPPHRPSDYIKGLVVVDKVKLYKREGERRVVIVFDRRVSLDVIKEALEDIGYSYRVVKEF